MARQVSHRAPAKVPGHIVANVGSEFASKRCTPISETNLLML
jgi:hypothetical protein